MTCWTKGYKVFQMVSTSPVSTEKPPWFNVMDIKRSFKNRLRDATALTSVMITFSSFFSLPLPIWPSIIITSAQPRGAIWTSAITGLTLPFCQTAFVAKNSSSLDLRLQSFNFLSAASAAVGFSLAVLMMIWPLRKIQDLNLRPAFTTKVTFEFFRSIWLSRDWFSTNTAFKYYGLPPTRVSTGETTVFLVRMLLGVERFATPLAFFLKIKKVSLRLGLLICNTALNRAKSFCSSAPPSFEGFFAKLTLKHAPLHSITRQGVNYVRISF